MDKQETSDQQKGDGPWERELVEKLVLSATREQTRARRWSIFFRLLVFIYIAIILVMTFWGDSFSEAEAQLGEHTAIINIDDVIDTEDRGISADNVVKGLKKAYKNDKVKGIILKINSPGGRPVQSARIWSSIRKLKEEHEKIPVYAVIEDIGASGAYFVAAAADHIYANESSIVGSIGVRMGEFGFVGTLDKLGIERRVITAGENKTVLDPFLPLTDEDRAHAEKMLNEVHSQFINAVKTGRGDRLKDDPDIFSGLFWSGVTAKELGLIDGFGDSTYVADKLIKAEKLVDYTYEDDPFKRLVSKFGLGVGEGLVKYATESGLELR